MLADYLRVFRCEELSPFLIIALLAFSWAGAAFADRQAWGMYGRKFGAAFGGAVGVLLAGAIYWALQDNCRV